MNLKNERRRREWFAGLGVVALLAFSLWLVMSAEAATSLPRACALLTRAEAKTLAGVDVQAPMPSRTSCTYNGYPTGPVAQVAIYLDSTLPRTLTIDRSLHHKIWRVRGLGNQAFEEDWNIFVRKRSVWVTVHLVRSDLWSADFQQRLEHAARIAVGRLRSPTRRLALAAKSPSARGGRERWIGKERQFGGSITNYQGVVYQPGVILIGGGASAVRARSADGLTWTIDGNAPGVSDLRVGKMMLATTFAAGRVLKLSRDGSNVRVVLGPAALTDFIHDGVFASNGLVPLAKPLVYRTLLPKRKKRARRIQSLTAPRDGAGSFANTTPYFSTRGVGVSILYDNGSTGRLAATVELYLAQPSVSFSIRIGSGRLLEANVQLHGAGGLRYEINGSTKDVSGNVNSGPIAIPMSFSIPLVGPLAVTLTQAFDVSMQLEGTASLAASGDYLIHGSLGFSLNGGKHAPQKPPMQTRAPITHQTVSTSVGVNAFRLRWKVRATVGLGVVGGSVGAYYQLEPTLALEADGSHLNSLKLGCVTAALDVSGYYGVGYTIPEFVRSVVNFFLRAVGAKPVQASGGVGWGPYTVWHPPQDEYCPPRKSMN